MDWSKARRLLEDRFAASVQGRVAIRVTRYRRAHDQEGELWVTVDGLKVYGSSYYQFIRDRSELEQASQNDKQILEPDDLNKTLWLHGTADHNLLISAAKDSLNHSVDTMLASDHPLIRALAVLDRRMGSRRLAALDLTNEHEFVRLAHQLRHTSPSAERAHPTAEELAQDKI